VILVRQIEVVHMDDVVVLVDRYESIVGELVAMYLIECTQKDEESGSTGSMIFLC
jgi:hypothetical protein